MMIRHLLLFKAITPTPSSHGRLKRMPEPFQPRDQLFACLERDVGAESSPVAEREAARRDWLAWAREQSTLMDVQIPATHSPTSRKARRYRDARREVR